MQMHLMCPILRSKVSPLHQWMHSCSCCSFLLASLFPHKPQVVVSRWTTLKSNLTVTDCSFVQNNMDEIIKLSVEKQQQDFLSTTVLIDFGQAPPGRYQTAD